ncbi:DUF2793 domain-containing protein [Sphingomonas psychrotolerans]|uniref:DUF2793 domain-containing protein n=1 Tax=Sphingomonas psychrotolerans TaxID=1327635 RepID=A0A2K8MN40_9SPHN|nr:DUF2793 domain-containing protein [Sphingomonas psychrotolerans]ATY33349.1 hypothetical protein CVN68_16405 [Sphingomonas psychrotolerans]
MTDNVTPRLAMPLLQSGQAQKEMTHNESLARLDLIVQGAVVAAGVDTPPTSPEPGACWLVGAAPDGVWAGHPHALAGWTRSGWIFVEPREGMQLSLGSTQGIARFSAGIWRLGELHGKVFVEGDQVVGPRGDAVAEPSGGSTVDAEARTAIVSILEAMRSHGLIEGG